MLHFSFGRQQESHDISTEILDILPLNVLTCDPETLRIDYASKKSIETLNKLADLLPEGVTGDTIIGQCIDVFHKHPARQRKLLSDPSNYPHQAIIRLGPELLDLYIDAIQEDGKVVKLVLSWMVCTDRERLKIMVDNMPINIMMADPENFKINYLNQTSRESLKSIDHLLPIDSANILGSSIDIFHERPEIQHKILSNPENLPVRSKIKVGEETLDLKVSAIVDNSGYYIGPMVSWSVVTAQENLSKNMISLSKMVTQSAQSLEETAQMLSQSSKLASDHASNVAGAANDASDNVRSAADAAGEVARSITHIQEQIVHADKVSREAVHKAQQTGQVMVRLGESSSRVGDVVNLIDDIAEQTNLLALNATIEAARAGDAGKGFAVVASEVKSLASGTKRATEEIKKQISEMQFISSEAVDTIASIGETIAQISNASSLITSAIEQQAAATHGISQNVSQASQSAIQVSTGMDKINNTSQKAGAASDNLLSLASRLVQKSDEMDEQIAAYLKQENAVDKNRH